MAGYVALEDYECDGCRADRLGIMGCGSCPCNDERKREWERKYGNHSTGHEVNVGGIYFED